MKVHLDCIPCFLKQSLEAARMATDDEEVQTQVMKEILKQLENINFEKSPPELSREVHRIIRTITKTKDPYKKIKDESNKRGEKIYKNLKKKIEKSKDILYLADNSGEIFFDRLLLEELNNLDKKITYVVKENPIINDALNYDVKYASIDKIADIITFDKGQTISTPGVVMNYASDEFKKIFEKSDMVISKGQGNYEGLSDTYKRVFFLLVAKCPIVADDIGSDVGKLILKVNK